MVTQRLSQYPEDGFSNACGWGNGYCGVTKDHPLFGVNHMDWESIPNTSTLGCNVHGGITYSELNKENDTWEFGFDTAHSGDNKENCSLEYVQEQTDMLKDALENFKADKDTVIREIERLLKLL